MCRISIVGLCRTNIPQAVCGGTAPPSARRTAQQNDVLVCEVVFCCELRNSGAFEHQIMVDFLVLQPRDSPAFVAVKQFLRRCGSKLVRVLAIANRTQKILQIAQLAEPRKLRRVSQSHVDKPRNAVSLNQSKKLLCGFLCEPNCVNHFVTSDFKMRQNIQCGQHLSSVGKII